MEPEFAAFQEWVLRFEASDEGKRAELAGEGLRLARVRREEMKALMEQIKAIMHDPRISRKNNTDQPFKLMSEYAGYIALFL